MIDLKATIEEMRESGMDDSMIVAALACVREVAPVVIPARSSAAERQQRYRERNKASQTVTSDASPSLPSKEGPQTPKETQPTLPTTQQEKTPKGVQKKASRLPTDWVLPEGWGRDAVEAGLPAHLIDLEASKMRDWSLSAPASKGAKTDWRPAWRNWCRGAVERLPQARGSPPRAMDNVIFSLIAEMDNADGHSAADIEGHSAAPLRLSASQR